MLGSSTHSRAITVALIAVSVVATSLSAAPIDRYARVNRSWDRFGSVYTRILEDYYTSMAPDSIMLGAIHGMLGRLDAYSRYYDAAGIRQLREDTTGKFAGLGMTVARMDGYPVVIAPMEGTPAARAGLMSGDRITAIEGEDTKSMSLGEVVDHLRGQPDSKVEITILHPGHPSLTRRVLLRRQLIEIPTVTLSTQIAPGVGYIGMRQTRFSEGTADEVSTAIDDLLQEGAQALVLDLRGNPGGLLSQATQVADLFLPQGAPIVSVRERDGQREETRRSQQRPRAGDLPLAVLIDGGSASASEIVAGAIQDNDRGIIVGTTSFGKGSVQTIFDLHGADSSALKLTTARYYTPSGRCIHREVSGQVQAGELLLSLGDQRVPLRTVLESVAGAQSAGEMRERLLTRFRLGETAVKQVLNSSLKDLLQRAVRAQASSDSAQGTEAHTVVYKTRGGRRVFGGGGITPDVVVEPPPLASYVRDLQRLDVFFRVAVSLVAQDSAHVAALHGEELNQTLVSALSEYLARHPDLPSFDKALRGEAEALRATAQTLGVSSQVDSALTGLEERLAHLAAGGFPPVLRRQLVRFLRPELALRLRGRRAQLRAQLEDDAQLQRAVDILLDRPAYAHALNPDRT